VTKLERKVQEIKEEFTKSVHSITGIMNGNDGEVTYHCSKVGSENMLISNSRDYLVKI
jgi:hypothetical protein